MPQSDGCDAANATQDILGHFCCQGMLLVCLLLATHRTAGTFLSKPLPSQPLPSSPTVLSQGVLPSQMLDFAFVLDEFYRAPVGPPLRPP